MRHTGTGKLQHFVFHIAVGEGGRHQRNGHILRADTLAGFALQPDQHHFRCRHIVGVFQQLLHQLAAAFAHAHAAVSAVAGVGVGAENHIAAGCQPLTGILVDHRLVGRHIDTAVLFRRRQAKGMVILIDGAAHRAQAVVAVGHGVGNRELLQAGGLGRLNNTDKCNIMGDQGIKLQPQLLRIVTAVMGAQHLVGHGLFPRRFRRFHARGCRDRLPVHQIHARFDQFYHGKILQSDGIISVSLSQ